MIRAREAGWMGRCRGAVAAGLAVGLWGCATAAVPPGLDPVDPATRAISDALTPPVASLPRPEYVRDVVWAETPGVDAMARAYPDRARRLGLRGSAGMECRAGADGRLSSCRLVDETPAGFGFGPAVLSLAPRFRAAPASESGAPVAGRPVRVGLSFQSGERHGEAGLCQAVLLALRGRAGDETAKAGAVADLQRRSPKIVTTAADARARIEGHAAVAALLAREQRASAERLSESCQEPRPQPNPDRFYPAPLTLWIDPAGAAHAVVRPTWGVAPAGELVARYYPGLARERELQGRTGMQCIVSMSGALQDCRLTEETPPGWGFGAAALGLARELRFRPETVDGRPVDGAVVTVPVLWLLPR